MTTGGWKGGWGSAQASKEGWERTRRRPPSRRPLVIRVLLVIAILALYFYGSGAVEQHEFSAYQHTPNSSPPLRAQSGGVILSAPHSRYLILDTIVVTLTNDSGAPIYLPGLQSYGDPNGLVHGWEYTLECQSDQGWQPCAHGFTVESVGFREAPEAPPVLAIGAVTSGATIILESVNGNAIAPLMQAGAYRFSVTYSTIPFKNPQQMPIGNSVTLTTVPMTLSSAWWIPPWYHAWAW